MGPGGRALSSIESHRFDTTCSLPTLHDSFGRSHPRHHRLARRHRPLQPVCLRLWRSSPAAPVAHCPLLSYGVGVPPHLFVLCSSVFLRSLCVVMITSFLVLFVFNLVLWLILRPNLPIILEKSYLNPIFYMLPQDLTTIDFDDDVNLVEKEAVVLSIVCLNSRSSATGFLDGVDDLTVLTLGLEDVAAPVPWTTSIVTTTRAAGADVEDTSLHREKRTRERSPRQEEIATAAVAMDLGSEPWRWVPELRFQGVRLDEVWSGAWWTRKDAMMAHCKDVRIGFDNSTVAVAGALVVPSPKNYRVLM
ncbi:hypothetical protein BHE74_00058092 [Ensete ventricosum]|nr:hypothetical protein BHE74_00058092 [Ensete ventricosum]